MRLHRLELAGFGPFRDRQVVDFDAFADDGIFLITGRTGAGKSSILDGVCFALYGDVPRYSGSDKRLRSDHCAPDDPTEVLLEFSLGDRRLRVARSPEYSRPKRRGEGFTPVKQRAQLDEWQDGTWVGRASGPRDVGLLLGEVLGLTREQFLQVILLAQGRFAQFLLAGNDERQAVLRTLFGTRRYEDYARALAERRKDAVADMETAQRSIEALLTHAEQVAVDGTPGEQSDPPQSGLPQPDGPPRPSVPVRIESLVEAEARAVGRVEECEKAVAGSSALRGRAEAALAEGKRVVRAQTDLAAARAAVARLEADADAIAAARTELDQARSAETLRATLELYDRRAAELVRAEAGETAARAALADAGFEDPDTDGTRLQAAVDGWIAELAAWQDAERLERELPARRARFEELSALRTDADREQRDLAATLLAAPGRIAELDDGIEEASGIAGAQAGLIERIEAETGRLAAAREHEALGPRAGEAEADYIAAAARANEAAVAVVELLRRRLQNHAGELAASLQAGQPCAVCGSTEHPRPAEPGPDLVTDEMIAAAEHERDARRTAESRAEETARELRRQRSDLAERSGGMSVPQLEERLADLSARAAAAAAARARRDDLAAERERLGEEAAAGGRRRDALADRITELTREIAAVEESVRAAEAQIATARGDAPSVAERIAAVGALRAAAVAVIEAIRTHASAVTSATDARADRDARVTASGFADAEAAAAALRDEGTRERLAELITAHDAQLAAHRARVRELEEQKLPEEAVDVTALQVRHDDADQAYRDAVARRAQAETVATALADLLAKIRGLHDVLGPLIADAERLGALADVVSGRGPNTHRMTLEAFVLAAELEQIVTQANVRLDEMSAGRYRLQHTDARAARGAASGLGIEVMDAFTGVARPASSLSGGETFLASLALALGLADVVTARAGGIRLDTLFVDEGFGSLDSETLEVAMNTLESLRHGGRTVGVISHVEAMREQLPTQLRVTANSHGPSRIEQHAPAGVAADAG